MKLEIGSKTRKKVGDFIADEKLTAVVFADLNFTQEHEKKTAAQLLINRRHAVPSSEQSERV